MPFGKPRSGAHLRKRCAFLTGKERDPESNNDYFGARYYFAGNARWLSVDPVAGNVADPRRLNRYSYTLNDPVNYLDPDGRDPQPIRCYDCDQEATVYGGIEGVLSPFGPLRAGSQRPPQIIGLDGPHESFGPQRGFEWDVERALGRLLTAFEAHTNDKDCTEFFEKLGSSAKAFSALFDSYIYAGGFKNGVTYNVRLLDLETHSKYQVWINAYMRDPERNLPPETTVADLFANPGLHGWAPFYTNLVFLRPGHVTPKLIGHEMVHKATGLGDTDIQKFLGITVDEKNTGNIADEFEKKCLR